MVWKLEVASNAAASAWTDRTSIVDRTTLTLSSIANRIETDAGSGFDLSDDAAAITLPLRRVVRFTEDATTPDTVLFRGRTVSSGIARGTKWSGDSRQHDVSLTDYNSDFGGIPVSRRFRPAETDVVRMTYVLNTWLQGTPRTSTNLTNTYLQSTSPVDLPENQYSDTNVAGIIGDIIEQTGKECFITKDGALFYGPTTSTAYAAGLSITDVNPNLTTEFAPGNPSADFDGTEYFSGIKVVYGPLGDQVVIVNRASVETANDIWRTTITDTGITTLAGALERANLFLDVFDHAEARYRCTLLLPDTKVDLIAYGQTVSFRSAAAGVTTPITVRVKRIAWEEAGPGFYNCSLELGMPLKLAARASAGGIASGGPGGNGNGTGNGGCGDCHNCCDDTPPESCPWSGFGDEAFYGSTSINPGPNLITAGVGGGVWAHKAAGAYDAGNAAVGNASTTIDASADTSSFGVPGTYYITYRTATDAPDTAPERNYSEQWVQVTINTATSFVTVRLEHFGGPDDTIVLAANGTVAGEGSFTFVGRFPEDGIIAIHVAASDDVDVTVDGQTFSLANVTGMSSGAESFSILAQQFFTNASPGGSPYESDARISALSFVADNGGAMPWCTGDSGQTVTEVFTGNGSQTAFTTADAYQPGTLEVETSGIPEPNITETNPGSGAFTFASAPFNGERITVTYRRA